VLTANGLGWSSIIYPGQTIAIPGIVHPDDVAPDTEVPEPVAPEGEPADEAPVADETPIVTVPVVETAPIAETPVEAPAPTPPAPANGSYTIVSGDTISRIAGAFGITTQALLDANGLDWSSVIHPGGTLVIPGVTTPVLSTVPTSSDGSITYLNDEMRANAAIIVQVGREQGVPDYGIIIALATAMQESSLRNLTWGDRDSVGLFQQRPSSGWGTVEELTNARHAAYTFYQGRAGYTRGLLDIAGWESMPLTVAAQRVQISAYPDAYAKWEASARAWFAELG
jgi:LysM repeat protein